MIMRKAIPQNKKLTTSFQFIPTKIIQILQIYWISPAKSPFPAAQAGKPGGKGV